jgi:hypothetical protein
VLRATFAVAIGLGSVAHADGIAIVGGSPRAIGRAGAGTVGDDGGGALLVNPAALARRDEWRAQAGIALVSDPISFQSSTSDAPLSRGQGSPAIAPLVAVAAGFGDWILGAGVMTSSASERSLARPGDIADNSLGAAYDYRYAGIAGSYRRDTATIGAARRFGESVAVGASLGVSRVAVSELRRVWAGFGGRDPVGSPAYGDIDVQLGGVSDFAPSAVVGVLYAPGDAPIELGASVAWMRDVHVHGGASGVGDERDTPRTGPAVDAATVSDSLVVQQPWTVRAGARYLGERVVAELDGDLWIAPRGADSATWSVDGLGVEDTRSGVRAPIADVPSRISQHTHAAVRTAVDVAVVRGFLWATIGYAYSTAGTPAAHLSPTFGDLGGNTLAFGLEGTAGTMTVTLGWSRTWELPTTAPSTLMLDNPFRAGDGSVPGGRYSGSIDQLGVLVEYSWPAK